MENVCDSVTQKGASVDYEIINVWVKTERNEKYNI